MKIIHIIPSLQTGGAERLCLDICKELSNRSDLIVKLYILRNINHFERHKFIKSIPSSIKLSITKKNQFNISLLQKEIENFKPDIIHSHLFEAEIVSRSINYPKARWFSHFHDNMPQLDNFSYLSIFDKQKLTNFYEKYYLLKRYKINGGNHFISISQDTNNFASQVLPKKYKYHYLKNAINYNKFNNENLKSKKGNLQLINIGSFQAKKNQTFLIDIAQTLKENKIKFHLTLIGDGNLRKAVEKKVTDLELENEVSFTGNIPNVQDYLSKSDIYIHSAFYEPFGLVLLEAMASGLPVVTLDGKGNRDIIEEGKNGYMIYEQDAEKFANTIIKLWNNKKKMEEISRYANEYAKQYDIVNYVDKLLLLYQNAIDSK